MDKIWKPVFGYENEYQVSSAGDVKRIKGGKGSVVGRILKPYLNTTTGYFIVTLSKDCVQRDYPLHRVVANAFFGTSTLHVNHKNGVKTDNTIGNLEFVTAKENLLHATTVLGLRCGTKHWNARLKPTDINKIRSLADSGLTQQQIADAFKVCRPTISEILSGKKWKCLPMPLIGGA